MRRVPCNCTTAPWTAPPAFCARLICPLGQQVARQALLTVCGMRTMGGLTQFIVMRSLATFAPQTDFSPASPCSSLSTAAQEAEEGRWRKNSRTVDRAFRKNGNGDVPTIVNHQCLSVPEPPAVHVYNVCACACLSAALFRGAPRHLCLWLALGIRL